MSIQSKLKYLHLAYLSTPGQDRCLYRAISAGRVSSIVEIGIKTGRRSVRMIELAQQCAGEKRVKYAGIDLFEARPATSPGVTLKTAHRLLAVTKAQVRLIPGDPFTALARSANALGQTDFVVISADQDRNSLAQAMFYLPRMMHSESQVFLEEPIAGTTKTRFREMLPIEIARIADIAHRGTRIARAA